MLTFFAENRLYFDPELVEAFQECNSALSASWTTFAYDQRDSASGPAPREENKRRLEAWKEARIVVRDRLPPAAPCPPHSSHALGQRVARRDTPALGSRRAPARRSRRER